MKFDYIKYDDVSTERSERYKKLVQELNDSVEKDLYGTREKSLFLTYLEIAHMWLGKAIKADQLQKRGAVTE